MASKTQVTIEDLYHVPDTVWTTRRIQSPPNVMTGRMQSLRFRDGI